MPTIDDEYLDPFDEHFRREPLPDAAVLVIVLDGDDPRRAGEVAATLRGWLAAKGRDAESVVIADATGAGPRSC
jgi:hypothetical protein